MSEPEAVALVTLSAGAWTLVPPQVDQAPEVLALFSDPDVRRWNPAPKVVDLDSAVEWLDRNSAWGAEWAVWSVVDANRRFVGTCVLWNMDRADHFNGSVGYRIAPWARRQGVATAAVGAMADFAFEELRLARLDLIHTVENAGSCRVAERAGFTLEGTLRSEYRTFDGTRWDSHLHSLLATDPRPPGWHQDPTSAGL